jgi:integrase
MTSKRRPRGEGSIYESGGKWIVRHWVGDRRLQRTARSQAEALALLDELRRREGGIVAPRDHTVADPAGDFLEHGRDIRHWAPATLRSYESAFRLHISPMIGKLVLRELSVREVQRLLDRLIENGHSPRHVVHVRGVLRSAISHAQRLELVSRNVAALAVVPPVPAAQAAALTVDQVRNLLTELDGHRLHALFMVAATLGLRRGELIALRWEVIDFDARILGVRRTGSFFGGEYVEGPPKSARSRRTIALPEEILSELHRHRAIVNEERLKLGGYWLDEDRVFPGRGGAPIGATTIRKTLNAALERAGLPHVRVHDLRHTAATMLIAAGGSLLDAQELLGHSTYTFTANTYAHALDEQKRATADRIDRLLRA